MKQFGMMFATAATAWLASCGPDEPVNLSVNAQGGDAAVQNGMPAGNAEAPAETAMPVPGANVREMEVYRDREPPRPAAPPEPEPDPHAGHDMNNMSDER